MLDAKVAEVQGHISALEHYRDSLVDQQRRAGHWERNVIGVVEALTLCSTSSPMACRGMTGAPWSSCWRSESVSRRTLTGLASDIPRRT